MPDLKKIVQHKFTMHCCNPFICNLLGKNDIFNVSSGKSIMTAVLKGASLGHPCKALLADKS
jgi:hypothetical protein